MDDAGLFHRFDVEPGDQSEGELSGDHRLDVGVLKAHDVTGIGFVDVGARLCDGDGLANTGALADDQADRSPRPNMRSGLSIGPTVEGCGGSARRTRQPSRGRSWPRMS